MSRSAYITPANKANSGNNFSPESCVETQLPGWKNPPARRTFLRRKAEIHCQFLQVIFQSKSPFLCSGMIESQFR
jgi:hypothetical protein